MPRDPNNYEAFDISLGEHLLSGALHATSGLWRRLGSLESSVMRERIERILIDRPIYITGLARSGTTILLEMTAAHEHVAAHRYRDFWSIFTPVWSAEATRGLRRSHSRPVERAHADGIFITPDSPEAIEEMLWMAFFQDLHNPRVCNVLDSGASNSPFEQYYRDHLRKLLMVRQRRRYASKANYNMTRLGYLLKLFPDARFVLPVREPRDQIASLRKQHRLLACAAKQHPRSLRYLDRVGHFEFGLHRKPINVGDSEAVEQILSCWRKGEEVRGWARYWALLYDFLASQLEADPRLREASLVVSYEQLCRDSEAELRRIFKHCQLDSVEPLIERYAPRLHRPDYYQPEFTDAEERIIEEEAAPVHQRLCNACLEGIP